MPARNFSSSTAKWPLVPIPGVETSYVVEGRIGDEPAAIGGAAEHGVVVTHEDAVGGDPEVGFKASITQVGGSLKSHGSVLGPQKPRAPMGDPYGPVRGHEDGGHLHVGLTQAVTI